LISIRDYLRLSVNQMEKKTITKSTQVKLEQESNISMSFSRLVEAIGKLQFH
jgi:hypothetical protein